MAVNFRAHNFSNNRVGGEGIGSKTGQGIYEESSTAIYPIGEKLELADGRVFRYGYTAAAINRGLLVSQDVSATAIVESDGKLTAASAGATEVTYTDSGTVGSATENQYAGGYLHITDDAGEGFQYRIKSNTAADSNAITFTLFDGLAVAVTTATDVAVTGSLWYNVVGATSTDYIVAGVTPITFQANYYGWFQTAGVATILADGTIAAGQNLTLSDGVAGAVHAKDAETEPLIGLAAFAPDDTGHVGVVLQNLVV
jgi:hypothetical protein|tara:strand:- start:2216 stop:2983 length:768 start_codon:yes stop_codon:yes gene_type:complete